MEQRAKGDRESQALVPKALASGVCLACFQDSTPGVKVRREKGW